jgi:putative membrane protein
MITSSSRLWAATATAASLLALAACNKGGGSPPAATDSANSAAATSSPVVAAAEDATAAGVGQVSAATTMTAGGFVTAAATSDMYEIQAAKIAEQKATSPAVKKFAAKMVHDHTASTAKLKSILAAGTVTATPPTDLDERRKGMINNLDAAAPADFDKTYVDQQVAAHGEAETLLKGYVDKGDNAALKTFATGILPTVEAHLAMVKSMKDSMK